jgi:putative peptide zinc metalloprotease protein
MSPVNSAKELQPIVRVAVEQDDVALLKGRVKAVDLQLAGDASHSYQSALLRDTPAALAKLPSAALGDKGGGELTTDPQDKDGLRTARPTFAFDVSLPADAIQSNGFVGQKAYVRFDLGSSPLAAQWLRRAQQTILLKFAPKDI